MREGTCAVPGPRRSNGLPTTPTAAYLAAEGISPTIGPWREGKEKAQDFEPVHQHVLWAMMCGGDPTQPTSIHQTITALHQR